MGDMDRVLLVGGSSRIPLVAELVAASTGRPVVVDAHPKLVVARGAARYGLDRLAAGAGLLVVPAAAGIAPAAAAGGGDLTMGADSPAIADASVEAPVAAAVGTRGTGSDPSSTGAGRPRSRRVAVAVIAGVAVLIVSGVVFAASRQPIGPPVAPVSALLSPSSGAGSEAPSELIAVASVVASAPASGDIAGPSPSPDPGIAAAGTGSPSVAPSATSRPTSGPKQTSAPGSTAAPGSTSTPKPTTTPKPKPTATPRPKPTATPKPTPTPVPHSDPTFRGVDAPATACQNQETWNVSAKVTFHGAVSSGGSYLDLKDANGTTQRYPESDENGIGQGITIIWLIDSRAFDYANPEFKDYTWKITVKDDHGGSSTTSGAVSADPAC
jgi:hypothetical protein